MQSLIVLVLDRGRLVLQKVPPQLEYQTLLEKKMLGALLEVKWEKQSKNINLLVLFSPEKRLDRFCQMKLQSQGDAL